MAAHKAKTHIIHRSFRHGLFLFVTRTSAHRTKSKQAHWRRVSGGAWLVLHTQLGFFIQQTHRDEKQHVLCCTESMHQVKTYLNESTLGATGGIHFLLSAAAFTCTLASDLKEKQASCYRHLLMQLKCSSSSSSLFSSFLSLTDIMLQSASLMKDIYTGMPLIPKQTRRATITEDSRFLISKIPHNGLQFRMFHILTTISRISHP